MDRWSKQRVLTDIVSPEARSRMMSGIRSTDTKPELLIRRGLHAVGFRFRLHDSRLPGKPDLVLPRYQAAVFVHGCFWHGHDCHLFKWPSSNARFWFDKIQQNRENDARAISSLIDQGWRVLVVWECALKGKRRWQFDQLIGRVIGWLKYLEPTLVIQGRLAPGNARG
jgi:DNA mismatch endonuclease (patch repair protein)